MTAGTSAPQAEDHNSHVERLILDCLLARCRREADALNKAETDLRLVATDVEYGYYLLAAARREPVVNSLASAMEVIHEAGSYLPRSPRTLIEQLITASHVHLTEGFIPEATCYSLRAFLLMQALGLRAPHMLWREVASEMLVSLRAMESIEAH